MTGRSAINFATKFFINFFRDYSRHLINSVHFVYSISDGTVFDRSLYSSGISYREHGTTVKKWREIESDGKKKWREIESGDNKKWRKIDSDSNTKMREYKNWRKHVRKWSLIGWQERNTRSNPDQKGREIESDAMIRTKRREPLSLIQIKKWWQIYLFFHWMQIQLNVTIPYFDQFSELSHWDVKWFIPSFVKAIL